jgi:hypothetical protein
MAQGIVDLLLLVEITVRRTWPVARCPIVVRDPKDDKVLAAALVFRSSQVA